MSNAFLTGSFFAAVGINYRDNTCGIYVGNENPDSVFVAQNKRPYIIMRKFEFTSAKKIPFARVVTQLRKKFEPVGGFNYPVNPDNKHFIGLPLDQIDNIINGMRVLVKGVADLDDNWQPIVTESQISEKEYSEMVSADMNKSPNMNTPSLIILAPKDAHVHVFKQITQ